MIIESLIALSAGRFLWETFKILHHMLYHLSWSNFYYTGYIRTAQYIERS